ncbi:MAG: hypothetical protein SF051_11530 [Elusimicrobiota bacterium]|nr:hypothetical protein [Elusimicrobiota bacterium]
MNNALAAAALAVFSLAALTGCAGAGGPPAASQPIEKYYGNHGHTHYDWSALQARIAKYDAFTAAWLSQGPLTEAVLVRGGRTTRLDAAGLAAALTDSKPGDLFRLGAGRFKLGEEIGGSPIVIEGVGPATVLTVGLKTRLKDATFSKLSLTDARLEPAPGHRVWLEQVIVLGHFRFLGNSAASKPSGSAVVSVLGGFYLKPQLSGNPRIQDPNENLWALTGNRHGTLSIEGQQLPSWLKRSELQTFFEEYARYLRGGPKPSPASVARLYANNRAVLDGDALKVRDGLPEAEEREALARAAITRMQNVLKTDFGAAGAAPAPGAGAADLWAKAEAAEKAGRPLTSFYHLARLSRQDLDSETGKKVDGRMRALRRAVAAAYGTSVEVELSGIGPDTARHAGYDGVEAYRASRSQQVGAFVRKPLEARYPILKLMDPAAARYRAKVFQTQDDFSNAAATTKVEEVRYEIEDPYVKAQKAKAAAAAAWARFDATMKGIDAAAANISKTWENTYNYRTRVEDTGSGKQLVWYEGAKNAGGLNLNAAADAAARAAGGAQAPSAGMMAASRNTQTRLYANRYAMTFSGQVERAGQGVIERLAQISREARWNFSCTVTTIDEGGVKRSDSNCFGGTGGGGGSTHVQAVVEASVVPWLFAHYEGRVIEENLPRLAKAAKSGDTAEMAEMVLLGRSLGVPANAEQDAVLAKALGDAKALEALVSVAAGM